MTMTMFLMNTMSAEVEPTGGLKGWFQLTGHKICRETAYADVADVLGDVADDVVHGAKIVGIHDADEEIEQQDPRFNDPDEPGFGVVKLGDGTYRMYLAVNRAEYVMFRHLAKNEAGEEADPANDPISDYRKPVTY
jgi:hypothetical protein